MHRDLKPDNILLDLSRTHLQVPSTSPQTRIEWSFSIAFICTLRRRIPASAGTNQGSDKSDLILL